MLFMVDKYEIMMWSRCRCRYDSCRQCLQSCNCCPRWWSYKMLSKLL